MEDIKKLKEQFERQLEANITKVTKDVTAVQDDVTAIQDNVSKLGTLGHWCAYKDGKQREIGTIDYDALTYSNSNMNIAGTPLDITTGIDSLVLLLL